jgi:hypothetical protein
MLNEGSLLDVRKIQSMTANPKQKMPEPRWIHVLSERPVANQFEGLMGWVIYKPARIATRLSTNQFASRLVS